MSVIDLSNVNPMIAGIVVLVGAYLVYNYLLVDPRRKHMPPLARGFPVINHTFIHQGPEFPNHLITWREEYGEIYRTKAGATDFIWLSSPRAVKELIDRRSAIYSSRQPQPMANDTASGGKRMTFMPKSRRWRTLRAIIHRVRRHMQC
jgi:hypothetical protein